MSLKMAKASVQRYLATRRGRGRLETLSCDERAHELLGLLIIGYERWYPVFIRSRKVARDE